MASKIPEEPPNTESGETLAIRMKKKRSRRVSFADTEITSVHIFNRDEDYDTPPNSKPSSRNDNGDLDPDNMVIGFFKDLGGDSEDSGDDEGIADARKSFLRPIGSPSPGSSTAGSVTSNDEDNFFGPVSASFIRPEQLSDSAASYDKYEDTMDTTAFSMHYRSLVRSESGEEPKTPTAVSLAFEEKTPTRNPTDSGSLMEITEPKKLTSQSLVPDGEVRGGEDSNDMSIVEKNPNKYDYGRLSPTIDALLAEGSKDLHTESATFIQNEASHIGQTNGELGNFGSHEMSAEAASAAGVRLRELNGGCLDQIAYDCLSNRNSGLAAAASTGRQIQSPNQLIRGNKEFPKDAFEGGMSKLETVDNGNIQKVDIMDLQFDVRSQHESAYQHLSEGSVIENSPKEGRHESDIDQNFDRQYASPLEGSLLSFWGQQSILNTPKSARHLDMISSSSKQLGFLLSREHLKPNESISSIQKSISRLRIPNPSPSVSSLKEGIDKLKCRLSSYSSMAFTDVLAENSKDLESKYVGAPVACLEEKLSSANLENQEYESIFVNIDSNGIEAPQSTGKLALNKEITGLEEDGEPLDYLVMGILSKDKATKPVIGVGSPSNMALSGRKVMQHILMSEISPKRTLVTFGTDSSSVNNGKANPHHLQVKSETVGTGQSPSRDTTIMNFQLESSEKNLKTGADPMLSESYISGSTPKLSALKSPTYNESTQSPLRTEPTQSSSSQIFGQMAALKEPALTSPMKWPTQSPSRKEPTRSSPRIEPIQSSPQKDLSQSTSRRELAWTPLRNEPTKSPSIKEPTKKSPRKESTKNSSRLGPSNPVHSDIMQSFARKDVPSPKSNSKTLSNEDCHQELHISRSPFFSQNTEISSERKRSIGVALDDVHHIDKIPRFQRSPDIHRSGNFGSELILHHSDKIYNEREKIEGDTALVHWSDFLVKFNKVTQQLLSPSINKLNFSAIGLLEDILVHLLKVRKYEMLGSEIQSQKVADCFNIRHKRVAETRLLLYKIAYEKAKLQLMGVKHENLQKRVQLLSSGIQECHMLKLNYNQRSESGTSDTHHQSCSVNFESEHQVVCDKISTMKQEIKVLDTKIKSLSNFFHCYCKLKGEPSCTDTIAFVQDHVKTRTCCRLLRQDLQLWQVVDFETRDGQYTVLLDYQGYLSQRFMLNSGPVSSIVISNELNDLNIVKNFPNMDARVAFQFVLNTEATRRGVSSKFFMQETQVVRSLLCNLLDVIHELQMAQIEIVNLTQTSFHSPSAEQLDLQLCFINFNSGRKVTLTLDLTCLNRGVYPSEILPHQVQDLTGGSQKLESEIKAAAGKLEVGFLRILRLCKCIPQAMQASSK